jgi:apolipoprotein N-acyltransferase
LFTDPVLTAAKFVAAIAILTTFGLALGWTRERFGFNPVLIALMWVGVEFGLIKLDFLSNAFGVTEFTGHYFFSLTALFGFLILSFLIVFIDSLLIVAVGRVISFVKSGEIGTTEPITRQVLIPITSGLARTINDTPGSRGPPFRLFALT